MKNKIAAFGFTAVLTMFHVSPVFAGSTSEVWTHHIEAWEARSVEEIKSDYSDKSVLILNNQVYKGQAEIGHVFSRLFEIFNDGSNRIDPPVLFDHFVYITWHFTPTGSQEFFGTDTFVVEDGKIVLQTIASPLYESFPVELPTRSRQ